jgi:uncharacterized protein YdiU (UPF0061 family)
MDIQHLALADTPAASSTLSTPGGWQPDQVRWATSYAALGPPFARPVQPQPLTRPHWLATSDGVAELLGWPADWWTHPDAIAPFAAHGLWPGMQSVATVYSGHQFGVWAGQLGDGRALLLGEVATPAGGLEIQLKGSGLTPYSRMGDGRAVLRSSIREFLCSEAMHGLGIPTTRALALVGSDLPVRREGIETAAIVARVAPSFLRFGHFEHFSHHGQHDALRQLFDHVVDRYAPQCRSAPEPVAALLAWVADSTAELLADWQAVGFCHGVMNTDNMSILGLTIDYGPFGFLDAFDPGHICNHSDHQGRYAFSRQPQIAHWNLHALAQALVPLLPSPDTEGLSGALEVYRERFGPALLQRLRAKLGLRDERAEDGELADDLLRLMAAGRVDHTIAWRRLGRFSTDTGADNAVVRDLFLDRIGFDAWADRYRVRLRAEQSIDAERGTRMQRINPHVVLRNHLAETAIRQAEAGDASEVRRLLRVLSQPFDEDLAQPTDADFPPGWAGSLAVSCSS